MIRVYLDVPGDRELVKEEEKSKFLGGRQEGFCSRVQDGRSCGEPARLLLRLPSLERILGACRRCGEICRSYLSGRVWMHSLGGTASTKKAVKGSCIIWKG